MTDQMISLAEGQTARYAEWLRSSVSHYGELAKSLISHRAEKGRIVESVVKAALRSILPGRFSIGTGFAITSSGKTSSQLDLVIYDAISNAPMILEGGTGLFPIESIYAFIEVKSSLDGAAVASACEAISTVRSFASEKRYVIYGARDVGDGKMVTVEQEVTYDLAPRSFIFAIDSPYGAITALEQKLGDETTRTAAHVHGLAVLEKDWFIAQKAHERDHTFERQDDHAFSAFCASVLYCIQSVQMYPASMRSYLGLTARDAMAKKGD